MRKNKTANTNKQGNTLNLLFPKTPKRCKKNSFV